MSAGLALFGGAFDPPHATHVRLARRAVRQLPVDELWVLPSGDHPHKSGRVEATPAQRLEMCKLAFGGLPGVVCSDFELHREGPTYTVDTVRALRAEHPGRPLYWLVGSDNLATLHTWHRHHELLSLCQLVTYPRAGHPIERRALERLPLTRREIDGLLGHILEGPLDAVSATAVRRALGAGGDAAERLAPDVLAPDVLAYIRSHGLYVGHGAKGTP